MMQVAKLLGQGILSGDGISSGFDHATQWSGLDVWCLALGYGLQLFLDFAGYSHIAIGAAQALGFVVPENFARPFESTSASVFWTRWHMSLSFWIRDYVFLPLAVVRREVWWRNLALIVSMVLFGLWHKASVLFVLWGCYHGVLLVLHRQVQQTQRKLDWVPAATFWTPISWIVTIVFINLGWILFRSPSLPAARQMFAAAISPAGYASHSISGSLYGLVATVAVGYAIVIGVADRLDRCSTAPGTSHPSIITFLARTRWFWIPPLYILALLIVLIVTHTRGSDAAQLMYRNF
jgi:alginate O-acetyltransferase complex protein AlgI